MSDAIFHGGKAGRSGLFDKGFSRPEPRRAGYGMGAAERRGASVPDGRIAMMVAHIKTRFQERIAEWMCAWILTGYGVIFLLPGDTFNRSPTYLALARIMGENEWGWACLVIGLLRFTVLTINGFWLPSYRLRSAFAFLSIFFWVQLTLGALFINNIGVGVFLYPALLIGDFYAVYKAILDYRFATALKEASKGASRTGTSGL